MRFPPDAHKPKADLDAAADNLDAELADEDNHEPEKDD